jgi:hypothetical protein
MSEKDAQLQERIEKLESRVSELEQRLDEGDPEPTVDGIKDFVLSLDFNSHSKNATAIGYYLEEFRDQESFATEDIREGFRECRMKEPGNLSDAMRRANDGGLIIRDGKDGHSKLYRVGIEGQKLINEGLDDDA